MSADELGPIDTSEAREPLTISAAAKDVITGTYDGADAAGMKIAGLAEVTDTRVVRVGDRSDSEVVGEAVDFTIRVGEDGRPLPPGTGDAASLLRITVTPVPVSGHVRWKAFVRQVSIETRRVFEVAMSGPSTAALEVLRDGRPFHEYADDPEYLHHAAELEADSPREAIAQALGGLVDGGRLIRATEFTDEQRERRRLGRGARVAAAVAATGAAVVAAVVALTSGGGGNGTTSARSADTEVDVSAPGDQEGRSGGTGTEPTTGGGANADLPASVDAVVVAASGTQVWDGATDRNLGADPDPLDTLLLVLFDPEAAGEGTDAVDALVVAWHPAGDAAPFTLATYQRVGDQDRRAAITSGPGLHQKYGEAFTEPRCAGSWGMAVRTTIQVGEAFSAYHYTDDGERIHELTFETLIAPEWFVNQHISLHTEVGIVFSILNEDNSGFSGDSAALFGAVSSDLSGAADHCFWF